LSASQVVVIWSSVPSDFRAASAGHARRERAALGEDHAEVLGVRACRGRELAHDVRQRVEVLVDDLGGGRVEGRREVDDHAVDLLVLDGRDHRVVGVEDGGFLGRLDHVDDRVVARRAGLGPELVGGQLAGLRGGRAGLHLRATPPG